MRFGLVGTGYWARVTHAPALACTEGAELTAVWGRDRRAAADLAAEYQATAYDDVSAFLAAVDAVSFAVPPDVQAPIATQAAREGKHLLLEKPVALTEAAADGLVEAVEQAGVAAPLENLDRVAALSVALGELTANARAGQTRHPCDVWFGRDVGRVLAEAQRQVDARHAARPSA